MLITALMIVILIISISLHEVGHAGAAYILGDPTAKQQGRLSLNPLVHLDIVGSIIFPLLLWVTNAGFLLGWAKPVPVNPNYFRSPRHGMMAVAIAGPLVNLGLMIIGWTMMKVTVSTGVGFQLLLSLYLINAVLMIFNLIPIPPLDGSRIVGGLLPQSMASYWQRLDPYGMPLIIIFIIMGGVDRVLSYFIPVVLKGVI
jgi:Zn-dependent protease